MKIAILGGGFTGLSAAYYLRKKGHEVTIFEKEAQLGGLAIGFKQPNWQWSLERGYHHMFATDSSTLQLAKDTGYTGIFFKTPETSALYKVGDNYRIFPVDTPQDFLRFPLLNLVDKLRTGLIVALLKLSPPLSPYDKFPSGTFFPKLMGKQGWKMIFGDLMQKKFGKYAENILAAFIWARIKVRTKSLGYMKGGWQTFVEYLEKKNEENGVIIKKKHEAQSIHTKRDLYRIMYKNEQGLTKEETFDAVISTLPIPIMNKVTTGLFTEKYLNRFKKLKYLHAVVLIIETKQSLLKKAYWLSICPSDIPFMFVGQHTNFIDKKYYGGNNIIYVARYVTTDDQLWTMNEKEIVTFFGPYLKKINPQFDLKKINTYLFKAPYAQPVFDKEFLENKPDFNTPLKNFYIANLDMTYPQDRGTNYAVKLGREIASLL